MNTTNSIRELKQPINNEEDGENRFLVSEKNLVNPSHNKRIRYSKIICVTITIILLSIALVVIFGCCNSFVFKLLFGYTQVTP